MAATHQPMSPSAAVRYQERWAVARERLNEELRSTPMDTKLRRLAGLMQSAREMGWSRSLDEEDDAVRARWMALRRALGQSDLLDEFDRIVASTRRKTAADDSIG